jgi:hypothetical protein
MVLFILALFLQDASSHQLSWPHLAESARRANLSLERKGRKLPARPSRTKRAMHAVFLCAVAALAAPGTGFVLQPSVHARARLARACHRSGA